MAQGTNHVINIFEDHSRWEEYKFDAFRNPGKDLQTNYPGLPASIQLKNVTEKQGSELSHPTSGIIDFYNRKMKPRRTLIRKEGQSNIAYKGIQKKRVKYLKDLYVTLLDLKWRWAFVILFSGFFLSYLTFAIIYFLLSYTHGDLDHVGDPKFKPCIVHLDSFWDALLFSMETQSTIGYGTIYPNAECAGTVPVVYLQITIGFLLETCLLGFIFVKIARPKHRRHTLIFSRNACLCKEDNQLMLQVRVGDMRNSHLIDSHVYGALVKRYVCEEKYVYPLFQHELEFEAHGMGEKIFLFWPMVLRHKITKDSPLYTLTPEDLIYDKFEIILFLEGTIESTGEMVQARTSFTSKEILWGHRFTRVEEYDDKADKWSMNFTRFHKVVPSKTPKCSAKELAENPSRLEEGEESTTDKQRTKQSIREMGASVDTLGGDTVYSTASEDGRDSDEA